MVAFQSQRRDADPSADDECIIEVAFQICSCEVIAFYIFYRGETEVTLLQSDVTGLGASIDVDMLGGNVNTLTSIFMTDHPKHVKLEYDHELDYLTIYGRISGRQLAHAFFDLKMQRYWPDCSPVEFHEFWHSGNFSTLAAMNTNEMLRVFGIVR